MTNKEIFKIAINEDILYHLSRIKIENDNMIHKTKYEKIAANNRIKEHTREIKLLLEQ